MENAELLRVRVWDRQFILESEFPANNCLLAHRGDDGVDWIRIVFADVCEAHLVLGENGKAEIGDSRDDLLFELLICRLVERMLSEGGCILMVSFGDLGTGRVPRMKRGGAWVDGYVKGWPTSMRYSAAGMLMARWPCAPPPLVECMARAFA
jgi:hypothetical protein